MIWPEITRKSIHLSSLVIPLSVLFLPRQVIIIILSCLLVFSLAVEWARFKWPWFSQIFYRLVGKLLRKHEFHHLTGATFIFISALVAMIFFEDWIVMVALLFLNISDAFGALAGRTWGRHFYMEGRSIEGSLAFVISGLLIILLVPNVDLRIAIPGLVIACLMEIFVDGKFDNLAIPIISGFSMQLLLILLY